MSIFVKPLIDKLQLIGEVDPEDVKGLILQDSSDSLNHKKTLFERVSNMMDIIFLKYPRARDFDSPSEEHPKRIGTLNENLKNYSTEEPRANSTIDERENSEIGYRKEKNDNLKEKEIEIDKGTSYAV